MAMAPPWVRRHRAYALSEGRTTVSSARSCGSRADSALLHPRPQQRDLPPPRSARARVHALVEPDRSGRWPDDTPQVSQPESSKRFTSHPCRRPTGRYEPQPLNDRPRQTNRRFTKSCRRSSPPTVRPQDQPTTRPDALAKAAKPLHPEERDVVIGLAGYPETRRDRRMSENSSYQRLAAISRACASPPPSGGPPS
jgi:hypothetical protein